MKHFIWCACTVAAILLAIFSYANFAANKSDHSAIQIHLQEGQHFSLIDHTGKIYDSKEQLSEGDYALLFFGFTHCPVICPTKLQKISQIIDLLPKETAAKIKPLFITIDPERDTVSVLADYIPLFHPAIIGLTGEPETIQAVINAWHVYAQKIEQPEYGSYTMDHSTYLYLVNHNMDVEALFRMRVSAEDIASEINKIAAKNN